jgi:hypothetical protein
MRPGARQGAGADGDARRESNLRYRQTDAYKANRKARREGPQREKILQQKRDSWERNKEVNARRAREARVADPERFKDYYRRKYAKDREKILTANREWAIANPEKVLAAHRRRVYGLTQEEYERKIAAQAGRCEICGADMHLTGEIFKAGSRRIGICLDHCHATGTVRGLLCPSCNKALGYFKDDPVRMRAAADYIERYRQASPA